MSDSPAEVAGEIKQPLKIAIVGTSPNHWHLAPFNDPEWQIWGMSRLFQDKRCSRWDCWFELHGTDELCGANGQPDNSEAAQNRRLYLEWLQQQTNPVYVREETPLIPTGVRYPIEEILKVFPRGYFTNTVSYATALAICMKPDELGLWGVDMAQSVEYRHQRPSVEYFLGLAEGMGIKVTLPVETTLLKVARLYAISDPTPMESVLVGKRKEMEQRSQQCRMQLEQGQVMNAAYGGALDMLRFFEENIDFETRTLKEQIILPKNGERPEPVKVGA